MSVIWSHVKTCGLSTLYTQAHHICEQLHNTNLRELTGNTVSKVYIHSMHSLFSAFVVVVNDTVSINQSINQSSFISGMTERRPAMHKSNTHSNSSRVMCLIFVFIKHSYNEVRVWQVCGLWLMAAVVSVCDVWGCISVMQRIEEVLVRGGHGQTVA